MDFLTVSLGTVHSRMTCEPKLDFRRLEQINKSFKIPLGIRCGAGLSDVQYQRLIASGVAKIKYYTALADIAGAHIRDNTRTDCRDEYTCLTAGVKEAVSTEVERCIRLWGSNDRAAELLTQSISWAPVEHLIIYNVSGITEHDAYSMMAEGQRVLSTIPGVREVGIGRAVKEDAKYSYTWLVHFCHPAVINSYREHPVHVAFADNLFRPVADERISIDYQMIEKECNGDCY